MSYTETGRSQRSSGVVIFDGGTRGDYFVRVDVHIPERLTAEERRLFVRLREISQQRN